MLEVEGNLDTRSFDSVDTSTHTWNGGSLALQDQLAPSATPSPMTADFPPQFMNVIYMMNPNDLRLSTAGQIPSSSADMWYGPGPAIPSNPPAHFVPRSLPGGMIQPTPANLHERYHQESVNQVPATMLANNSRPLTYRTLLAHTGSLNTGQTITNEHRPYLGLMNNVDVNHPETAYSKNPNYIQSRDKRTLEKKAKAPRVQAKAVGPLTEQNKATKQPNFELDKLPMKKNLARSQISNLKAGLVAFGTANDHPEELRHSRIKPPNRRLINTFLELEGSESPSLGWQQNEKKKYNVAPPDKDTILRDNTRDIWALRKDYYRNKGNGTVKMMEKIMAGSPITDLRREYSVPRDEMLRRISMLAAISLEVLETQGISKDLFLEVLAQHEEGNGREIPNIIEMMHHDKEN